MCLCCDGSSNQAIGLWSGWYSHRVIGRMDNYPIVSTCGRPVCAHFQLLHVRITEGSRKQISKRGRLAAGFLRRFFIPRVFVPVATCGTVHCVKVRRISASVPLLRRSLLLRHGRAKEICCCARYERLRCCVRCRRLLTRYLYNLNNSLLLYFCFLRCADPWLE